MVDGTDAAFDIHLATGDDVDACEAILRQLPDWFGIEESIAAYVEDMQAMELLVARAGDEIAGFLALNEHNESTTEIHVMAVARRFHRRGIGRKLIEAAAVIAVERGKRLLEVKTLGPSHPDPNYAGTRRFYAALGFLPVEEIHGLWPGNPCLIMVKVLDDIA